MAEDLDLGTDRLPIDRFGVRLAIIRAERKWNFEQAGAACDIDPQTWRLWERGERSPRNYEETCRKVATGSEFPIAWIMAGGPLQKLKFLNAGITGVFTNPEPELPFPANDPGHLASVK